VVGDHRAAKAKVMAEAVKSGGFGNQLQIRTDMITIVCGDITGAGKDGSKSIYHPRG
jgi:hypothetical protein